MSSLFMWHQATLAGFIFLLVLIALSNLVVMRRLGDYPAPASFPRVSVLVPARVARLSWRGRMSRRGRR